MTPCFIKSKVPSTVRQTISLCTTEKGNEHCQLHYDVTLSYVLEFLYLPKELT